MTRRLALCFDGTWNTVGDHTNVSRIHAAIRGIPDDAPDADAQIKYYDEGVGTHWYDRVRGGMLGMGLAENVRQAYAWLIRHHKADSQLFLFGFSRGAFTARSLAGLINRCGIPPAPSGADEKAIEVLAEQAYDVYRGSRSPDQASKEFLTQRSREASIHFIGVWDTVGALGVPLVNLNLAERFHDMALGANVANAYHALAIDEHRRDYAAALWTANPGNARLEQRWFPGAHSNIGGGYQDDLLPDISLDWIADRARECGLIIEDEATRLDGSEYRTPVRDSFGDFMFGAYRLFKFGRRYHRPIGETIGETVDESAFKKWAADPEYRPENLAHAGAAIASPGVGISRGTLPAAAATRPARARAKTAKTEA